MRGILYLSCFACMAAGIIASRTCGAAAPVLIASLLLAACLSIPCKRIRRYALLIVLPLALTLLGSLLMLSSSSSISKGLLAGLARRSSTVQVCGRVCSTPRAEGGQTSFFLKVYEAQSAGKTWSTRERVEVIARERLAVGVHAGVNVLVRGRLSQPGRNKGWLEDSGAAALLIVSEGGITLSDQAADLVSRGVASSRAWLSSAYRKLFDRRTAGFLEGVSLSKTDRMDDALVADLRATGLSHIVAISGMNVTSAAALALIMLGFAGAGRKAKYVGAIVMALAVLAISDFSVSAARAVVMGGACFAGSMFGRRYDPLAGISIAGIVLLCINPRTLYQASFQYSFAAALGIVIIMAARESEDISGWRLAVAVCSAAQLGILPLMLARGDLVPVVAIFANLLVVWSLGLLLFASWTAALLSMISLPAARIVAVAPSAMSRYIIAVASACARLPGAGFSLGALSVAALLLYGAALFMFAFRRRTVFAPCVALGLSVALVLLASFNPAVRDGRGSITVLDVGEGDAILLRGMGGTVTLVDGGPDPGIVMRKLRSAGVGRIDLMVATHPHADHCAGLVEVMRRMPVGRLLEPGLSSENGGPYGELKALSGRLRVPTVIAREGQRIQVEPTLSLDVLYAPGSLSRIPHNLNDCSIVMMANAGEARMLLCGDIQSDGQKVLLAAHPSMSCDVMKVPHQGAANGATPGLFDAARPALAIISVGRHNTFGHPSRACLSLLASRGIRTARTDRGGDVAVSFANGRIILRERRR